MCGLSGLVSVHNLPNTGRPVTTAALLVDEQPLLVPARPLALTLNELVPHTVHANVVAGVEFEGGELHVSHACTVSDDELSSVGGKTGPERPCEPAASVHECWHKPRPHNATGPHTTRDHASCRGLERQRRWRQADRGIMSSDSGVSSASSSRQVARSVV